MDSKKPIIKTEDSPPQSSENQDAKADVEPQQSLAPPARRANSTTAGTPDYFSAVHNPLALEPNPFEQSFGGGSGETPGKSLLPPVAALTSPSLPGNNTSGYNWSNSLRSGPLSPAMLAGPTGGSDYFDSINRGFPTPNESSLRTGLTPGGGGSMFPAPSPNSQAILQQLQSGGATPSTIEFRRTALNAAKKTGLSAPTSNPTEPNQVPQSTTMEMKSDQTATADPFTHHEAADAANGLFMLAKGGQANNSHYPLPNQASLPLHNMQNVDSVRRGSNLNGAATGGREMSGEASDAQVEQTRPNTRAKGKKAAAAKTSSTTSNRRKAEDSSVKGPNKKAKANTASTEPISDPGESQEEEEQRKKPTTDPKKMTDEEKRRNFLERNRVAALKCRQRKKQWLANLQAKVEMFTTENDTLTATVTQLREEIVNLKTLLLAHKDCPVSQAQGLGPLMMNGLPSAFETHHPYSMPANLGLQPGAPIPTQGMRR